MKWCAGACAAGDGAWINRFAICALEPKEYRLLVDTVTGTSSLSKLCDLFNGDSSVADED